MRSSAKFSQVSVLREPKVNTLPSIFHSSSTTPTPQQNTHALKLKRLTPSNIISNTIVQQQ